MILCFCSFSGVTTIFVLYIFIFMIIYLISWFYIFRFSYKVFFDSGINAMLSMNRKLCTGICFILVPNSIHSILNIPTDSCFFLPCLALESRFYHKFFIHIISKAFVDNGLLFAFLIVYLKDEYQIFCCLSRSKTLLSINLCCIQFFQIF